MATNIELAALATRESKTESVTRADGTFEVQPHEVDKETVEAIVDLDGTVADERSVTLTQLWDFVTNGQADHRLPIVEMKVEGSADQIAWHDVYTLPRIDLSRDGQSGSRAFAFLSPYRYIRLRHVLKPPFQGQKGYVRWSLAGKKS